MDRERMIEVLKMDRDLALFDPTTGECRPMNELNAESAEALDMAIKELEGNDTNVPTNSALDHIHNVVRDDAYRRGYEQAKAEYDHKLTEIKSRFKDRYYNKGYSEGYEQGKADAAPKWIPFTAETMPKEDGEYFVLYDDKYAEDYDTGSVGVADFYVDCEAFGYWQERYDPVTLGYVDSDFIEIKVKKWMPIPKDEEGKDDNI